MLSIDTIELTTVPPDLRDVAANDCDVGPTYALTDVELVVATTVARVTARVQPEFVNVVLDLSADGAVVSCNPTALAFALAGILGAVLRAADDNGDEEILRVAVSLHQQQVRVSIAGPDVPPLGMIRALSGQAAGPMADPTVAHCRRLIESEGGTLGLGTYGGELAVELCLPAHPQGRGLRVLTPRSLRTTTPPARFVRALAC